MAIYQRIKAWERCHELCVAVYQATEAWPIDERFGLSSQARRAAHSAAANIAEGSAKKGSREFRRYLNISLGSLSELSYTLLLARDLKILQRNEWEKLDELHRKAGGMTWLLYKALLPRKVTQGAQGAAEPSP
jgi:four helix bundle protein